MHMALSEHLQDKVMELEGLKYQAGQMAGVWGKNQPTKILAKQSCTLKGLLPFKDYDEMPLHRKERPEVVTRGGGDMLGAFLGGSHYE